MRFCNQYSGRKKNEKGQDLPDTEVAGSRCLLAFHPAGKHRLSFDVIHLQHDPLIRGGDIMRGVTWECIVVQPEDLLGNTCRESA